MPRGRGIGERKDRTDLPSAAATPSRLFKRPLKLNVEPSFASAVVVVVEGLVVDVVAVGVPVELESRVRERVKAASKSSKRRMHLQMKHYEQPQWMISKY